MSENEFGDSSREGFIVYDLRVKPDGTMDLTLSHIHRQLLVLIAHRGGEIDYDFSLLKKDEDPEWEAANVKRFGEPLAPHVRRLTTMGLVKEIPIIGRPSDHVTLRLTDMGRNVVTKIIENLGVVI